MHGRLLIDLMQDSRMGRLIFGMHWGTMEFTQHDHSSDRPV